MAQKYVVVERKNPLKPQEPAKFMQWLVAIASGYRRSYQSCIRAFLLFYR